MFCRLPICHIRPAILEFSRNSYTIDSRIGGNAMFSIIYL
jgi:hypothetical protein